MAAALSLLGYVKMRGGILSGRFIILRSGWCGVTSFVSNLQAVIAIDRKHCSREVYNCAGFRIFDLFAGPESPRSAR